MPSVADDPDALRAAGLCGGKNRHAWHCLAGCEEPWRKSDLVDGNCPECGAATEERPIGKYAYCHRTPDRHSRRQRCKQHNGRPATGTAHGRYKTGKYARTLTGRYLRTYEEALAGGELPHLLEEIALLEVRERELIEEIESRRAQGAVYDDLWDTFHATADQRRKLLETQQRIMGASDGYVPTPEVLLFVAKILQAMDQYLADKRGVGRVKAEVERLMLAGPAQAAQRTGTADAPAADR